jgi:UDP-N-acetylglucosamine--N-acetylmuramyl-(pentapeptide) pyrophosphoryl-undecaprenol N-acetylglucosamine transferase
MESRPHAQQKLHPADSEAAGVSTARVRRIAIAGGYTAGHVLAGLAFLKTYREEFGAEGCFIGCPGGVEDRLVPAHGERLLLIPGAAFARQGIWGQLAAVVGMLRGAFAARRLLHREHIDVVIGVGGYASVGTGLAAWSLGIPLVIHEANARPGLANLMLARVARRVCVGFQEAGRRFRNARFRKPRVEFTGNPATVGPFAAKAAAGPLRVPLRMLVSGGSLGSPFLNREAPRLLAELRAPGCEFTVRHLAGTPHPKSRAASAVEEIRRAYAESGIEARVDPFTDSIADAYADADFVIAGAGALTLADISAAGLPALLVPLADAANDHQSDNARAYCSHTGALWVAERDWNTRRIAGQIAELLGNRPRFDDIARRSHAFGRPGAALALVSICEEVLGGARVTGGRLR